MSSAGASVVDLIVGFSPIEGSVPEFCVVPLESQGPVEELHLARWPTHVEAGDQAKELQRPPVDESKLFLRDSRVLERLSMAMRCRKTGSSISPRAALERCSSPLI